MAPHIPFALFLATLHGADGNIYEAQSNPFREDAAAFCHYVEIFSQQVARNKVRNVPYSRIEEFSYFAPSFATFLEEIAVEIYGRSRGQEFSIEDAGKKFRSECEQEF